jgi:hypothetical protein
MGEGDIARLAPLVAARQQEYQGLATPREINAVARTVIDPQFVDPAADELRIAKQSDLNPRQKQPFSVIARSPCDEAIQGLRDAAPKPAGAVRRPLDCCALLAMTG